MEVMEEVIEAIVDENGVIPAYLLSIMTFITATPVLSGIFFSIFSVLHIIKNWNILKNHLKIKSAKLNKEVLLSLFWIAVLAILGIIITIIK